MNKVRAVAQGNGTGVVYGAIPTRLPEVVGRHASRRGVGAALSDRSSRVRCMRVTFWGVQGSVPVASTGRAVADYQSHTMEFAIRRLGALGESSAGRDHLKRLLAGESGDKLVHEIIEMIGHPHLPTFGGETTSIAIETDEGNTLIFDGGTGVRGCATDLDTRWANAENRTVHLFGTHEHLDHRNGLPFSRLCYAQPRPFDIHVYATRQFLEALDDRYGMFTHRLSQTVYYDDPVDYRMMSATFHATELRSEHDDHTVPWKTHFISEPIRIGSTTVTPFDVYHGATRCMAYRIAHRDRVFVFSTDHELRRSTDRHPELQARSETAEASLRAACMDADLAYFDGQYLLAEYRGERGIGSAAAVSRVDWGHGCVEDCIERAKTCRIRRTYIGHHDPERTWAERLRIDESLAAHSQPGKMDIRLANDEEIVDI